MPNDMKNMAASTERGSLWGYFWNLTASVSVVFFEGFAVSLDNVGLFKHVVYFGMIFESVVEGILGALNLWKALSGCTPCSRELVAHQG